MLAETFSSAILGLWRRRLFLPYTVELRNGERLVVPHPEALAIYDNLAELHEPDDTKRYFDIPGTISESGFMTNRAFDELSTKPEYPKQEAAAITKGAIKYWNEHKAALIALREKLMKERTAHPRDPKTYTSIDLNPDFRARMQTLLAQVEPSGKYDPAKIGTYVENFKKAVVTDPAATFTVKGEFDGQRIKLSGATSNRTYHDRLIDMLIAMKLYNIANSIEFLKSQ